MRQTVDSSIYKVGGELCNPNADEKTKRIMAYLTEIYGHKTLSGQYTNHNFSTETDAIHKLTGNYPAVRGFDFIFYSPNCGGDRNPCDTDLALAWDRKGGLVTFSWHWHGPVGNPTFYTKDTDFDITKAMTDINIAEMTLPELKKLHEEGQISEECYLIVRDIDVISEQLAILQDNHVTVLWRPLHEAAGKWFWWGAKGAEPCKWLWRLLYERQTNYHGLNNLIWVWNGQAADWYPGGDVTDIAGNDLYVEKHDYSAQTEMFLETAAMAPGKPVALTENGVVPDPDELDADNTRWLWFNTWCREFVVDKEGNYDETYTEAEIVKKMYASENVITLEKLPKF